MNQPRCTNAEKVLPHPLLTQVRRHVSGLVWIPPAKRRRFKTQKLPARDARMRRARRNGATTERLARDFHISASRAWEIVKNVRMKKSSHRRSA